MSDVAYNAGLEIRYAIAASGVDPIQHIPEVDAIIERLLDEARRHAFIEAAEIAKKEMKRMALPYTGEILVAALRAKAEETQG